MDTNTIDCIRALVKQNEYSNAPGYVIFSLMVLHIIYTYQSVCQRETLRDQASFLIERWRRQKELDAVNKLIEENKVQNLTNKVDVVCNNMQEIATITDPTDNQVVSDADFKPIVCLESKELINTDASEVLNHALLNLEKDLKTFAEINIQVDITDLVEKEELVGLDQEELNLVEEQIRQEEEDKKREEEYAKIETILQDNLMKTKDFAFGESQKLVEKVEKIMESILPLKKGINAIRQKDIENIRSVMEEIDDSDWIRILRERYADSALAQRLADDLEHMKGRCVLLLNKFEDILRMRSKIEELKQSTIAEIRSYSDPPTSVGEVMRATFLLLGETAVNVQKWSNIRILLGKMGKKAVKHRILNYDMTSLNGKYQTLKKAKLLCRDQTLAEIEAVSAGAAVFFSWCMVTIDTLETTW